MTMLRNIDPEIRKVEATLRQSKRRAADVRIKISTNISQRMYASLKKNKQGLHWEGVVGYSAKELMSHLEGQFKNGMSWANYGSYWHVDHKIPIVAFNFKTVSDIDFKKCWALENLQPLEAVLNMRKGARLYEPFQPSLAMGS